MCQVNSNQCIGCYVSIEIRKLETWGKKLFQTHYSMVKEKNSTTAVIVKQDYLF